MKRSSLIVIIFSIILLTLGVLVGYKYYPFKNPLKPQTEQLVKEVPPIDENINCQKYINDLSYWPDSSILPYLNFLTVTTPPIEIKDGKTVYAQKDDFDPKKERAGEFDLPPGETNPWTEKKFDVDGDGQQERILSANTAMNHTPHIALIVKDKKVLFESVGANNVIEGVGGYETKDSKANGFINTSTLDWNEGFKQKHTRYIFENGGFKPIYYQISCSGNKS